MNCHKCGAVLKADMLFCPECGTRAEKQIYCIVCQSPVDPSAKFCSKCGAKITVSAEPNEGSQDPFSDFVHKTSEASAPAGAPFTPPSNPDTSPSAESFERKKQGFIKKKLSAFWNKLSLYSKIMATLIAIFALFGLFAFCFGKMAAGVLAIIQIALVVIALLIKKQRIKTKKTWTHVVALIVAIVLLFPYVNLLSDDAGKFPSITKPSVSSPITNPDTPSSSSANSTTTPSEPAIVYEELKWPKNALANLIPVPSSIYGEVEHSTEEKLSLRIDQVSQDDFYEYISACTDNGFVNVKKESASEFEATDQDGYRLTLRLSSDDEMSITVKQPLYTIDLTVNCLYNLLFNTYDLVVYLDGDEIGSIAHGDKATMNLNLEKGSYTLEVRKHGYKSPKGTVTIEVKESAKISYRAQCGEDVISLTQTEYISLRPLTETEARVPASASDLRYDHYEEVVDSLTAAGFTNIKTAILYDIVWGITDKGEVASVSIAGDSDFDTGAIFDKTAEVVVTYHMDEEDDPSRIKMSKAATDYEGSHYTSVEKTFKELGFTNIVLEKVETSDTAYDEGEVSRITIDYEHFSSGNSYKPTDKVLIKYYTIKPVTPSETPDTSKPDDKPIDEPVAEEKHEEKPVINVVLPPAGSKLAKDLDSQGKTTVYYINVEGQSNTPSLKKWGSITVTDGVAEYLDYLKSLGYTVSIINSSHEEPWYGYHVYEAEFKVSGSNKSWTMNLYIQDEYTVEYELDIHLPK